MPKKIIVGLDGSEPSDKALDWVLDEAGARDLDIVLVTVADHMEVFSARPDYIPFLDKVMDEARETLERGLSRVRAAGFEARVVVETGRPASKIVEAARREKADEIVVGSLGKHALDRLLVGSVSSRLVETAPCTVVVVR